MRLFIWAESRNISTPSSVFQEYELARNLSEFYFFHNI
jgi:hypothetical protein